MGHFFSIKLYFYLFIVLKVVEVPFYGDGFCIGPDNIRANDPVVRPRNCALKSKLENSSSLVRYQRCHSI
eukprot:m.236026 g.236026  ORF g.236026 m.236026 type:complete len:70 (-) comp15770_c0_seq1:292-501(-)